MADAKRDQNFVPTLLAVSDDDGVTPVAVYADPTTHRLLVDIPGGTGTVSDVSVVTANGFAGTVATSTTTPAITLTTSVTGILKGNGTAISAITVGSGLAYDGTTLSSTATGDVTKVGTPVNNQVGVWTGDGTIEGDAGLTFDTATDLLTTGILNSTSLTASEIVITDASKNLVSAAVATYPSLTELSYVKGVTSALQTQINAKGTGNVTKVGTPVDNQVGVWTGDGTIEGPTTLTFDGDILTVTNDTDQASNQVLVLQGDRATPSTNDTLYQSFLLSDSAGNQDEMARIETIATDVTSTSEDSLLGFYVRTAGTFARKIVLQGAALAPHSNDNIALGTASVSFSDLYLAEGGVINWDNGDATITQTGNVLAIAGADLRVATADVGTNADSVPTLSSTSTLTNKTLTSPTLTTPSAFTTGGTITLAENTSIALDPAGSADGKYTGITVAGTAGAALAFGDLIYLDPTDSRWELADANAASGADGDSRGILGICVLAAAGDGSATTILLNGIVRADTAFPAFTINNPIYVSETAGDVTQTQPTTTDVVIRIVGSALTADEMYFNPDWAWITHT